MPGIFVGWRNIFVEDSDHSAVMVKFGVTSLVFHLPIFKIPIDILIPPLAWLDGGLKNNSVSATATASGP